MTKLPEFITNNIELPLISAPMFLVSGIDLVVACCENGVIGSFPFTNTRTIEELENWIVEIETRLKNKKKDNKNLKIAPWAANIIVHSTYTRLDAELDLIKKYKPSIVITALGNPSKVVKVVHEYGGIVFSDVNNIEFAKKAAGTGVDGLILICSGAGGHTGQISPFVFVEIVKEFWDGIIILSGSICSGKGIKASLTLGADLAYMGTSFIPTHESLASKEYKNALINGNISDLILTPAVSGVNAFFIKSSLIDAGYSLEDLNKPNVINFNNLKPPNDTTKKAWKDIWSSGQGISKINEICSTNDLIKKLKIEYAQI